MDLVYQPEGSSPPAGWLRWLRLESSVELFWRRLFAYWPGFDRAKSGLDKSNHAVLDGDRAGPALRTVFDLHCAFALRLRCTRPLLVSENGPWPPRWPAPEVELGPRSRFRGLTAPWPWFAAAGIEARRIGEWGRSPLLQPGPEATAIADVVLGSPPEPVGEVWAEVVCERPKGPGLLFVDAPGGGVALLAGAVTATGLAWRPVVGDGRVRGDGAALAALREALG
jgi:hypothetical protein